MNHRKMYPLSSSKTDFIRNFHEAWLAATNKVQLASTHPLEQQQHKRYRELTFTRGLTNQKTYTEAHRHQCKEEKIIDVIYYYASKPTNFLLGNLVLQ